MMLSFKEYLKIKHNELAFFLHGEASEKYHTPLSHNGQGSLGLHLYWKHGCVIQTGFLSKSALIMAKRSMYVF